MGIRFTYIFGVLSIVLISSCNGQQAVTTETDTLVASDGSAERPLQIGSSATIIYQDSDLNYWFAGNDGGPLRWNGETFEQFTVADGLASSSILGIQEDDAGNIYFDTPEGISVFDGDGFRTLEVSEGSHAWQLEPGDLWFRKGWDGKGPYRFDGERLHALEFPKPAMVDTFYTRYPNAPFSPYGVYSIYTDRSGHLWFGTSSLGLCRFDGDSIHWMYEEHLTTTPQGGAFGIRSIMEDEDGYFWMCNPTYRYRMHASSNLQQETPMIRYERLDGRNMNDDLPYFMSMASNAQNEHWMATYDGGVYRVRGEQVNHFPVKIGAVQAMVFSVYCDRKGTPWLGTHNLGALRFDGEKFERFIP